MPDKTGAARRRLSESREENLTYGLVAETGNGLIEYRAN